MSLKRFSLSANCLRTTSFLPFFKLANSLSRFSRLYNNWFAWQSSPASGLDLNSSGFLLYADLPSCNFFTCTSSLLGKNISLRSKSSVVLWLVSILNFYSTLACFPRLRWWSCINSRWILSSSLLIWRMSSLMNSSMFRSSSRVHLVVSRGLEPCDLSRLLAADPRDT